MLDNEIYLVVNAGSSSLKFTAYQMPNRVTLISGNFEKIGLGDSFYSITINDKKIPRDVRVANHEQAISLLIAELFKNNIIKDLDEIKGVGHRVVHGGNKYSEPTIIDDQVIETVRSLIPFAPLHNPANLTGIECMKKSIPNAVNVAVFDTAFHQTIPPKNYIYAIPHELSEDFGIRKYGFHGISCEYIIGEMKYILQKDDVNLIICHIGGGASITAIKNSKSYDTSMGLTPLDGLIMGTRCGSIDPSVPEYICKQTGASLSDVMHLLNKESGILGLTGKSDLRDVEKLYNEGNEKAILALDMYTDAIVTYFADYYFKLENKVDAVVFTAGVGENQSLIRKLVIDKISKVLDVKVDTSKNENTGKSKKIQTGIISTEDSVVQVWVVPTDEESIILNATYSLTEKMKNGSSFVKQKR